MVEITAEEARKTPWLKRSKEERRAIFEERETHRKEKYGDLPSWGELAKGDRMEGVPATERPSSVSTTTRPKVGKAKFEGATLTSDGVRYKGTVVPLPATARVETAGEVRRRITATRLVATGVFAFALRKKKDDRELYLTVEGDGGAFVLDVDPKKGKQAREFAAKVNSAR